MPGVGFIGMSDTNLNNFVSPLLIDGSYGPERVQNKHERGFEVEIESGFQAPWNVSDVGEDAFGEGISIEVLNAWVDHIEAGVGVTGRNSRVAVLFDYELPEACVVDPLPLIGNGAERVIESDLDEGDREDVGLRCFELSKTDLLRYLVLQISLLIGAYQSYNAIVVDRQNGGVIEGVS